MDREFLDRTEFARYQRGHATNGEAGLWRYLRKPGIGYKFTRQAPIGRYFADFCCRSRRVVVEIDGDHHQRRLEEDEARDQFMESEGYVVLRFSANDVYGETGRVLEQIRAVCESRPTFRF